MPDDRQLARSYEYCRRTTKVAARNFYYGFALLPAEKRDALCALYAFMRHADDISDSNQEPDKRARLMEWRNVMNRALQGDYGQNPVLPALHHTVKQYGISASYLQDLMAGAEMDLRVHRYVTFEPLARYCYCVAGTVGLCCVHVFGFQDPAALELASKLGTAFQLTNILRDVPEDYAMGRIYLPLEDLQRFGCTEHDLGRPVASPAFVDLMRFECKRAWQYYSEAAPLVELISRDSRAALWTLRRIYSRILEKIESIGYDVLSKPHPSLSTAEKAWIMVRAGAGLWKPGYANISLNQNVEGNTKTQRH
jgi:phytoene synthase